VMILKIEPARSSRRWPGSSSPGPGYG
jgi:hypothetical protein